MNHQPFREWLLSEEQLSVEQNKALQDHLRSCESCSQIESAWKELESAIQKSSQVMPAQGFSQRWQAHLVEYQFHQQKRREWSIIGVTGLIVTFLSVLLITQLWSLIQAPGPFLIELLNRVMSVVSIYYLLQNIVNSYSWYIPIYTFIGIFFLFGIVSFMSVLWMTAYRKFNFARREV